MCGPSPKGKLVRLGDSTRNDQSDPNEQQGGFLKQQVDCTRGVVVERVPRRRPVAIHSNFWCGHWAEQAVHTGVHTSVCRKLRAFEGGGQG